MGDGNIKTLHIIPPCTIIFENKSDAIGIRSLILFRVHRAIRRSSENIDQ